MLKSSTTRSISVRNLIPTKVLALTDPSEHSLGRLYRLCNSRWSTRFLTACAAPSPPHPPSTTLYSGYTSYIKSAIVHPSRYSAVMIPHISPSNSETRRRKSNTAVLHATAVVHNNTPVTLSDSRFLLDIEDSFSRRFNVAEPNVRLFHKAR